MKKNAAFFWGCDAVPKQRVHELFGDEVAGYFDYDAARAKKNRGTRFFSIGIDFNISSVDNGDDLIHFSKTGFMKFVSVHNFLLCTAKTPGGTMPGSQSRSPLVTLSAQEVQELSKDI